MNYCSYRPALGSPASVQRQTHVRDTVTSPRLPDEPRSKVPHAFSRFQMLFLHFQELFHDRASSEAGAAPSVSHRKHLPLPLLIFTTSPGERSLHLGCCAPPAGLPPGLPPSGLPGDGWWKNNRRWRIYDPSHSLLS